ncbi:MAG: tetratricopeptide repeat protein, partial [Pseudomonadota bacterium]|nr:tetratricopeptide repeat protein [Pseudomonadota bacterium]
MAQHSAGQLNQAIASYDQILAALPQQPGALHLKGVAMAQMGNLGSGIELLQQAAAAKNDSVDIHNNLGNLLWQA